MKIVPVHPVKKVMRPSADVSSVLNCMVLLKRDLALVESGIRRLDKLVLKDTNDGVGSCAGYPKSINHFHSGRRRRRLTILEDKVCQEVEQGLLQAPSISGRFINLSALHKQEL